MKWLKTIQYLGITIMVVSATWLYIQSEDYKSERDALREEVADLQEKVDTLGVLALEANDQWIVCLHDRTKYIDAYRSVAVNCTKELEFFRPESTQVVNGVLLERAKSSHTAWNGGVADK